jgi:tetratricopeptide (TPR) repeat protein
MTSRGHAISIVIVAAALGAATLAQNPVGPGQSSGGAGQTSVGPASSDARQGGQLTARENAYRANNIGVARLEQYDFPAAVAAFRRALELDPALSLARLNLGIALFYAGEQDEARKELEAAKTALPDRPQADYVLGLIARAADRTDDAVRAFSRVHELDPTDAGAAINLGQLLVQQRKFDEALKLLRPAVESEPFNATAAYGLATALVRSGAAEEGRVAMDKFQKLRESGYAVTFSQAYLEQGRYAEAVASTGAEAGLLNEAIPAVRFTPAAGPTEATPPGGSVTLADLDGDGDLDLIEADALGLRLYRNDRGRFTAMPVGAQLPGPPVGVVAGDCDNDGDADLLVLRASGVSLLRQEAKGRFVDATSAAGLAGFTAAARTAAWLDADHDGDLDLLIGGAAGATRLYRNSGKATFEDITAAAGLQGLPALAAVVPTDYDNRRDIDMLLVPASGSPALYRNMRDGTFKNVAADVGLMLEGTSLMAAAGDVNKDGYVDFFFARAGAPGTFALSDGRGRFTLSAADPVTADAHAAQFIDYDNDGLLDLVAVTPGGIRVLRNLGSRWMDVSAAAMPGPSAALDPGSATLAAGDTDGDGDTDVIVRGRAPAILRNDGGDKGGAVRVQLTARVSNRSGLGTKIEMRAGSLRQRMENYSATPSPAPADIVFGIGARAGADVVRVLWPSGILQAEAAAIGAGRGSSDANQAALTGLVKIEELDRKPSSCPFLFTWNGERFEFLTDFLGGGEMGYWEAPGQRNVPDPDEYVRIPGDKLQPREGRLELRVTNELEEALFLDRTQLVAVDHPRGTEVYPNEGLRTEVQPFRLVTAQTIQPLAAAADEHGHDVLDQLNAVDRRYPDDFGKEPVRGYAVEHSLTLTLPPAAAGGRRVLLMTGWTDYSFSGDNVAAHQRGLKMTPPMLQVPDGPGRWRTVIDDIGFPVGRPQTVPVDLTGAVSRDVTRVRIVTTMRVYWDQLVVATTDETLTPLFTRLEPRTADLRWRGFSAEVTPDGKEPFTYDYTRVSQDSPWKLMPGRYTRLGDVRELLLKTDDLFVIARPGDEVALSFDAAALPRLPAGWTRTFLLYGSGYSKEMDLNSSSPDELAPLPFAGMKQYPYRPAEGPRATADRQRYSDRYLTRIVARPLPPIELIGAR